MNSGCEIVGTLATCRARAGAVCTTTVSVTSASILGPDGQRSRQRPGRVCRYQARARCLRAGLQSLDKVAEERRGLRADVAMRVGWSPAGLFRVDPRGKCTAMRLEVGSNGR